MCPRKDYCWKVSRRAADEQVSSEDLEMEIQLMEQELSESGKELFRQAWRKDDQNNHATL